LTKKKVAIKAISKEKARHYKQEDKIWREVEIHQKLNHRNVVRMFEVIDTPKHLLIVMEYIDKGELLDLINSKTRLVEAEARKLFQQLIAAVEHCHSKGVVHRDL
jgi:serine/threonine protein kinase